MSDKMNNFFAVIRGNGCKLMFFHLLQCPGGCDGVSGVVNHTPRTPLALTRAGTISRQCDTVSGAIRKRFILGFWSLAISHRSKRSNGNQNTTTKAIKGRRDKLLRPCFIVWSEITEPSRRKNNFHKPKQKKQSIEKIFFSSSLTALLIVFDYNFPSFGVYFLMAFSARSVGLIVSH